MGEKIGSPVQKVLMLCGHPGVNYSRELLWIGLKRVLDAREVAYGGLEEYAMEYPRMEFLYDDFPLEGASGIYGKGFTYSRRLDSALKKGGEWTEERIRASILAKKWDVILYGKVGPDELEGGSMESMPFWGDVARIYGPNEIAFLYGGDECQDMTSLNRYSAHLMRHVGHGICFVREISTG
jgi:hypothetical protein